MSLSTPAVKSSRFARYATASAAALGATAAADAQFVGDYSLTTGSGNTGAWNSSTGSAMSSFSAGGAPDSVSFSVNTYGNSNLFLAAPVTVDTTVSFDWSVQYSFSYSSGSTAAFNDGVAGNTFSSFSGGGSASDSGRSSFLVAAGNTFGFQFNLSYGNGSQSLTISNFSAVTAVPEPGTAGLLAGCAALGFVAVVGVRAKRRRAAGQPVE
jgi:hypothetical protein